MREILINLFLKSVCMGGAILCCLMQWSCSQNDLGNKAETLLTEGPKLLAVNFWMTDNPLQLSDNVSSEIIGDSIGECWIRHLINDKHLIPTFDFVGDNITIGGVKHKEGDIIDFKTPVKIMVHSHEKYKEYTVYVYSYTGLPVVWIETDNRTAITSKDEYVNAKFKLEENVVTRAAGDVIETDVQIKGRGNTSWNMAPKQPYRLKFNEKQSLFDEPMDKSWVLIANYFDFTMLRNKTAYYMGSLSSLQYTPSFHFVELMLNGRYNGTYMLGDHLKISPNRINVGNDGFLIEIDSKAIYESTPYFTVPHISRPINIKDPDVEIGGEAYNYIKDFVTKVDKVLYSTSFKDPEKGWQKYIDMDSFVDWYLINEIARNGDGLFVSSCYMNLERGGKLKMGPLWDFDNAFGKHYNAYSAEGWYIKNAEWISRLFEDEAFVNKVKERFAYFYSRRQDILRYINENAQYLRFAVEENENRWRTLYTEVPYNYNIWGSYQNEIQLLKQWLIIRFEWLKQEISNLN